MTIDLKGKVSLVTGASRGIGRAIALALGAAGSDVAVSYQHSEDSAEEVVAELRRLGVRAEGAAADISDEEACNIMVQKVLQDFGAVDILVNNAGVNRDRSFLKMTRAMWDEVLGVNLNGPFNVTHAVLPRMIEKGWGRIINITSMVGETGGFGQANYAVTKGGMIAFSMTLARELARKGITVNALSPGYTATDLTIDLPEQALDQLTGLIPVGRLATPEEIAAGAVFLASPQASYITGHVLSINGGMYM